jgi:hypothetical protein
VRALDQRCSAHRTGHDRRVYPDEPYGWEDLKIGLICRHHHDFTGHAVCRRRNRHIRNAGLKIFAIESSSSAGPSTGLWSRSTHHTPKYLGCGPDRPRPRRREPCRPNCCASGAHSNGLKRRSRRKKSEFCKPGLNLRNTAFKPHRTDGGFAPMIQFRPQGEHG